MLHLKVRLAQRIRGFLPVRARRSILGAGLVIGDDLVFPGIEPSLTVLRDWGYRPAFAVDVGAFIGEWTDLFRRVFPTCRVLMVEPQAEKQTALRAVCSRAPDAIRAVQALVGPTDGTEVEFFEMETGSSVLPEISAVTRSVTQMRTVTLDALLSREASDWGMPDFVKLDVQGYELSVLAGALEAMRHCDFVLLEAALLPYNEGAPLLPDVLAHMTSNGFHLLDFCSQLRRSDGALVQTDLLFVSSRSTFAARRLDPPSGLTYAGLRRG
ncbi:MAG: FkbM family methyltransferase [Acidimicrobiia bacterium]